MVTHTLDCMARAISPEHNEDGNSHIELYGKRWSA
uniref:Uncharacterized protein n=1 Tax=Arundo donax TaxID=35708 RepID=A0A0A9FXM3_ARUDO